MGSRVTALTFEEHRAHHIELHKALGELVGDWIRHTGKRPSQGTILDLLEWSAAEMVTPTPTPE